MKGNSLIKVLVYCLASGCHPAQENAEGDLQTAPVAGRHQVLAVVQEEAVRTYFIRTDQDGCHLMITQVPGEPVLTDTLTRGEGGLLILKGKHNTFYITEDSVIQTFYQKIIHPSSNWQGQTPGLETVVTRHKRRDVQ